MLVVEHCAALTRELKQQTAPIEEIRIERRPVVEQQLGGRRTRARRAVRNHAQQVLDHVVLQRHQTLQQLAVVLRLVGVLEHQHDDGGHGLARVALLVFEHALPGDGERQHKVAQRIEDLLVHGGGQHRHAGRRQVRNVVDQVLVEERHNAAEALQNRLAEVCDGWII